MRTNSRQQRAKREEKRQQKRALRTASQIRASETLRAPRSRPMITPDTNADYYAVIKKYHDYIDRGLIKPSSNLDKYEAANEFLDTLDMRGRVDVMRTATEKADKLLKESMERKRQYESDDYYFNKWGF